MCYLMVSCELSSYIILLGGTAVSWKSNKQHTVALSTAESEYRSIRRVTTELTWLSRILHELGVEGITPITVNCDNKAAMYIARNPVFHERTKHIELDCHLVREKIKEGLITLQYVPSGDQLADILTKQGSARDYKNFLDRTGHQDTETEQDHNRD